MSLTPAQTLGPYFAIGLTREAGGRGRSPMASASPDGSSTAPASRFPTLWCSIGP